MCFTDDPVADFERHDAYMSRMLDRLPVCDLCRERIQQDTAVVFCGSWICDHCLDSMREDTQDEEF